jgi:hypothetical protein
MSRIVIAVPSVLLGSGFIQYSKEDSLSKSESVSVLNNMVGDT